MLTVTRGNAIVRGIELAARKKGIVMNGISRHGWVGRQVRVYSSKSELANCREAWERLQWHPHADRDFFELINRSRRNIKGPCVLGLLRDKEIESLWIGRISIESVPISFGYWKMGALQLRQLGFVRGGLLGTSSQESARFLLSEARQLLANKSLDVLDFEAVPGDDPLIQIVRDQACWYERDLAVHSNPHWIMTLPRSFDEFLHLRSRKHRYWLSRMHKTLANSFPDQVQIRIFQNTSEVADFSRDATIISRQTYQHRLGAGFNAEHISRSELLSRKGAFRGYILYVRGEPKAYWLATAYKRTIYLHLTGYVPEFRAFEIGTILLLKVIADHCGTEIDRMDFGAGSAAYKERFCDECWSEVPLRIYRVAPRPIFLNLFRSVTCSSSVLGKRVLSKLGVLQSLKTSWRQKLTPRTSCAGSNS